MRISDWSSDVCSSDLLPPLPATCTYARACQRQVSAEKLRPVKKSPMNGRNPEMKKELVTRLHKSFEDAVHHQEGTEYWLARELQELLGYTTRSEEHTSELQSLMRISYAVFCLKKKKINKYNDKTTNTTIYKQTKKTH